MKTLTTKRALIITAIVIAFLTMAPGANASMFSFLDPVSEFFGWQSPQKNNALAANRINKQLSGERLNILELSLFEPVPSYTIVGAAVLQDFNTLGSSGTATLPADWRFGSSTAYSSGLTAATLAAGTSGTGILTSTSGGGYYNFANGVTASSTDRAVGWLTSSTFTSPRQLFVKLTNNTGTTIGSANIAYDIEKYRSGTRTFTINFFTSTDGTNWIAQPSGDQSYSGNANNTTVFNPPTAISKSVTVSDLSIANGGDLYLRWSYTGTFSGGSSSTNAQGLGIDNFSFTPIAATPGTVQFDSTSYTDLEGATKTITVNRTGGSLGAISVNYATGGGTATGAATCAAGVDYINASGTLNWADGNTAAKTFNVQLCNDAVADTENLQLTLSNPVGTAISGTNPVTLDIIDNPPGTLQFFSSSSNADENLPSAAVLVSRAGGSSGTVSADYAVTGGTAAGGAACTAGVDYITPAPGTLTWTNGDSADKFIDVPLCTDLITYEGPETIELTLSNAQGGAALGSPTVTTLTINDVGARFFNNTQIVINGGPSSPYPSDINVAGLPGAITDVKVTLIGVTHNYPDDVDILLVSPAGQKFVLMSDIGGSTPITNRTYTFSDAAANFMSDSSFNNHGTYKPTNYDVSQQDDNFESPAPAAPYFTPGPDGSDTFAGAFGNTDANGAWSLYVRDAFPGSDNGSINAGWSLEIKTTAPGPGTVAFSAPVYSDNEGATATINVKRVTGGLGSVSVDYATGGGSANGGAACGAGVDYVNTSGTLTWGDGDVSQKSFTVQLCSDVLTTESNETVDLTLSNPVGTTISGTNPATLTIVNNDFDGSTFSNHNSIAIPDSGSATPYPSTITVSGMTGSISNMRLRLNDISHTFSADVSILLVGPQGQAFIPYSNAGPGAPISNVSVILTDSATGLVPLDVFPSGTYKPTNLDNPANYPAPAPSSPYFSPGTIGSDTFLSTYGGTDPNGTWSLYVFDKAGGDQGQIAGGWDLDITTAAPTPGTVEFSSASFNGSEGSTATITANRAGGILGAISVDYATSSGTAAGGGACGAGVDYVNTAGTLSWADGDSTPQTFTVSLCSDAESSEPTETVNLALSNPAGTAISGTNPATLNIENNSFTGSTFSNADPIVIPNVGSATPYPSTITVSGMTGAITEVRMVLKNFSHTYTSDVDILLVSPAGQKFVAMSDVGGNTPSSGVTLTLRDSAAANMTVAALATGSYKPTDIPSNPDNWPAPAPSGPYNSPAPWGGMTFASVFNGSDPNGVWSLYVRDQFSPDGGAIAGWDLQIATAETARFNPGNYTPMENAGTVSLQVVRPSSGYAATVDYTLGSAGALYPAVGGASCDSGIDYINTPGTLNFEIGELTENINITLCDDGVFDGLKIILPELSNPTGGMILGSPSVATVFINDDETPPTLSIGDVTVNEGAGTASFVVTQSFATSSLTQFLYSTSDGTALAGFDYTAATNATGGIPAGDTTANIVVPITQDSGFEETETFNVGLTSVINATPADPVAIGTITDDDTAASYVVTSTNNSNDGSCDATHCSLREAMNASNAAPGIISFAPGLSGTITLTGSRPQITNNVVINGPGADVLAVSGNNAITVFEIPNAGTTVTIRGLTIRNGFNLEFGQGGAVTNGGLMTVENSVITASRGNFAGAIQTYGPLTVRSSTLSNNIGGNDGMQPGCSSIGGAIDSSNEVTINIISSTITGNSVATNCSANSGAINLFAGRVMVTNSTITNNTSSDISAAIGGFSPTTSVIRNSIIAGNTGDPSGADVQGSPGAFASEGFNIIGNPGGVTEFNLPSDQTGSTLSPLDPMLGALGSNGGHTPTHLPLAGSPAIDKGNSFGSTTDQRGSARPSDDGAITNASGGDGSDIGAVEIAVPMTLQFSAATYSDNETNSDHTFNVVVQRFGGSAGAVSVDYSVTDGTATVADNDYSISPATGTLNWADGDAADKNIAITVKGDTTFEPDETINLAISNATGGALLGSPSSAILTITNDDGQPTISVDDTVFGGDTLVPGAFTVSLSNPSSQTVTAHYATADDTALGGEDYTSASGTLTFDPGETSKTVPVSVSSNTTNEATEQFFLNLDTPTNATIADGQGIGTIFDDDPFATVAIGDVTHNEGNSGTTSYTFTVTKTGDTAQTISVDYATFNGAAVSPSDFTGVSGTLTFLPTEFTKTVTVYVNGDTDFEADEVFYVRLFNPVAVDIIDGEGSGTITNDDAPTLYLVNTNNDVDDGVCDVAHCSLREAINWANSTGGQINFAPSVTGSINLLGPLPAISNPNAIVINGPGASVLTVRRDSSIGAMRIFDINGAGVYTISGLAINDGDVRPIGGAFNNLGGAIRIMAGRGVTINNCTFTNNWADNAAAIYNGANPATNPLIVNNSTFTANNANQSGGGIYNRFGNTVTVNNSTFDANGAPTFGGGIYNRNNGVVFVNDSLFTGNAANSGAGIFNDDNGSITINRSNFTGNNAAVGAAVNNKDGGMDVFNSTMSGNTSSSQGGAAFNRLGTLNFFNSTLSGNTSGSLGGAIYYTFEGASNGMLSNCTITGNHSANGGGVMIFNGQSVVRIRNTILAGNTALTSGPDLYGTIYSSGYNILGTTGGGFGHMDPAPGDQIGQFSIINPLLGPLADNGGPTKTRAPLPGSPAIDAGNAFGETADQRGFARTVNGATDIGAFEIQNAPASIAAFSGTPQSAVVGGSYAPLQARVLDSNNDPVGGVPVTFNAPSSGASGTFPGAVFSATAVTNGNGVATAPVFTANNTDGSFQVSAGYAASPLAAFNLTNTAKPSISVDDVTFTGADSLVPAGFTVSISEASPNTITVHYQTADGTAIAGEDYTAVSGTLTFDPGETSKPVPVNILPNNVHENAEQFFLNLDSPNSNAAIGDGQGVGTIPNDDAAPTLAIDDVTHNEGYTGTTNFTFTVTKTGDTALSASVDYAILDGSATLAGNDYQAASGQLSFLASETSKTITVNVNGDFTNEPDENFTVHLSNAAAATISDADGAGTIVNDDAPPAITYVDDDWTSLALGTDPDGAGPAIAIGYDSFDTIQEGIDAVTANGTVRVYAGIYTGNVDLNKPVTLTGTATIFGSLSASVSGAKVSPGIGATGAGFFNPNNDLSLVAGSSVDLNINGYNPGTEYDQINTAGSVNLGGATLNVSIAFVPGINDTFLLINNQAAGAVNGTFAGLPQGATITINGMPMKISYTGGTGNDITLFLPPSQVVYVDDDWTGTTPGTDPDGAGPATSFGWDAFNTIQGGINGVAPFTGTVNVYPGTYKENPNVNKITTLKGANAGIAGGAVRGPESVVVSNGNQNQVFFLNTFDTTIDGFTIDGDDPAVAGAPLASGEDTNVQYGFRPVNGSFNLTIKNNIVKRAFVGFRGDNGSGGNSIDGNWFDSIGNFDFGYAVSLRNNYYTNVTNNKMTRVWTGVHTNNFSSAGPANWNVTGNEIHSYAAGLFHNLQYGTATGLNFSNNQLSAETGAAADNFGILIAGVQNSVAMTVSGNTISGTDYGIGLTNASTSNVITVDPSNSITGVTKAGVYLTDNLAFNPVSTADLTSNAFADPIAVKLNGLSIGTATGATGVKIENSRASATDVTNTAEITGVTINGSGVKGLEVTGPMTNVTMKISTITSVGTGIALQNSSATPMTVNAHFNRIIAVMAIDNPNNQSVDLENNWWGCNAGPGNAGCGTVTGTGADFDPWLVLGISASPNPITPGASATVTADITRNSDNAAPSASEFVPQIGVSFGSTQGTIAPPAGTITSGQAASLFTSTSTSSGAASSTVDNQTVNTNIGVTPPSFSIDDVTLNEGDSGSTAFTFTVTKTGATAFNSEVSLSVSDGTATQGSDHNGLSGLLTFLPSDVSKTMTVVVNADTVYENNETFFVNLFNPVNATVDDGQGLGTITNDDAPPALSIDDHTFTGADSLAVAGFTVTLNGATDLPVTVHYQSSNDTAIAGEDYTAVGGTLTFNPGETTKPIPVNILPDSTQEPAEQFFVDLDTPANASIADGHGIGTIPNDDAGPTFAVDDVTHNEGHSGTTSYTFTITKTGSTALSSTVSYNTVDASAVSPDDYAAATGSVVFGPADTTKQVTVQANGDIGYEPDETFTLHLSGTDNGSISDADGTGTIANDDVPAGVQFSAAAYMEDESQSAAITITRTGDTTGTTTVSFATSTGNATAGASCSLGVDYIETSVTVTFDPNDTAKMVNVPVCVDTYPESAQTVNLNLSNPIAPAVLGTQNTAVLSINDTASQYRSAGPIVISSNVPANPYPSILPVSGAPNTSGSVRVTLYDVSHSNPEDLDILLVSPTGQKFILMADAGGANALNPAVTLTFDDNAFQVLPDSGAITTRKYEPTSWVSPVTDFAAPAPAGPYSEPGSSVGGAVSLRNIFGAFSPNGNWSLYVRDNSSVPPFAPQGTGLIAGGWGLEFLAPTAATADISGRVLTADGRPIANVRVILSGGGLTESRSAYTSHLGYYFFEDLTAGQSYVLTIKSRRFDFANPTRLINLMDDLTGEDFIAEPQE